MDERSANMKIKTLKQYLVLKKRKGLSMEMLIMILIALGMMATLGPIFLEAIAKSGDQASSCANPLANALSNAGNIDTC